MVWFSNKTLKKATVSVLYLASKAPATTNPPQQPPNKLKMTTGKRKQQQDQKIKEKQKQTPQHNEDYQKVFSIVRGWYMALCDWKKGVLDKDDNPTPHPGELPEEYRAIAFANRECFPEICRNRSGCTLANQGIPHHCKENRCDNHNTENCTRRAGPLKSTDVTSVCCAYCDSKENLKKNAHTHPLSECGHICYTCPHDDDDDKLHYPWDCPRLRDARAAEEKNFGEFKEHPREHGSAPAHADDSKFSSSLPGAPPAYSSAQPSAQPKAWDSKLQNQLEITKREKEHVEREKEHVEREKELVEREKELEKKKRAEENAGSPQHPRSYGRRSPLDKAMWGDMDKQFTAARSGGNAFAQQSNYDDDGDESCHSEVLQSLPPPRKIYTHVPYYGNSSQATAAAASQQAPPPMYQHPNIHLTNFGDGTYFIRDEDRSSSPSEIFVFGNGSRARYNGIIYNVVWEE